MSIMMIKICKKCKEEKPIEAFNKHPRFKDGYNSQCTKCRIAARKTGKIAQTIYFEYLEKPIIKNMGLPIAYQEYKIKELSRCWICKSYWGPKGIKNCNCLE